MDDLPQALRSKAMDWLAQREYSRHEISQKLHDRFSRELRKQHAGNQNVEGQIAEGLAGLAKAIAATLDWLETQNFLNDERCARLFVGSYINRGYGALRIRQELVFRKGLAERLVEQQMAEAQCDWLQLARQVLLRRFPGPAKDMKEKARRLRFLQSRGFLADQCYGALNLTDVDT